MWLQLAPVLSLRRPRSHLKEARAIQVQATTASDVARVRAPALQHMQEGLRRLQDLHISGLAFTTTTVPASCEAPSMVAVTQPGECPGQHVEAVWTSSAAVPWAW